MVTTTRTGMTSLEHILTNVLEAADPSPLRTFFTIQGITSSSTFTNLTVDDISATTFKYDGNDQILNLSDRTRMLALQRWFFAQQPGATNLSWLTLTADLFDQWMDAHPRAEVVNNNHLDPSVGSSETAELIETPTTITLPPYRAPKRDISNYEVIKDRGVFGQWLRIARATSAVHDTSMVFDSAYVPSSTTSKSIFDSANEFMYAVLANKIQYAAGVNIVRSHASNAQKAIIFLTKDAFQGITGDTLKAQLKTALTELKLDDSWGKTGEAFLIMWQTSLLNLEDTLRMNADPIVITDTEKRQWLTDSLSSNGDFLTVFNNILAIESCQRFTNPTSSSEFPFDNWFTLVYRMVVARDTFLKKTKASSAKAKVNNTDVATTSSRRPPRDDDWKIKQDLYHAKLKQVDMYIEPDVFKKMSREEREAHTTAARLKVASLNETAAPIPATTIQTNNILLAPSTASTNSPPADLATMLSVAALKRSANNLQVNIHHVGCSDSHPGSLLDNGANNGLAGADVLFIDDTGRKADVTTPTGSTQGLPMATVAGYTDSITGPVIVIMHQYAYTGTGRTIHSENQLRAYGNIIDTIPRSLVPTPGVAALTTNCGRTIPFSFRDGLCYFDMRKPTQAEYDALPHVVLNSDSTWNPASIDYEFESTPATEDHGEVLLDDDGFPPLAPPRLHQLHSSTISTEEDTLEDRLDRLYYSSTLDVDDDPARAGDLTYEWSDTTPMTTPFHTHDNIFDLDNPHTVSIHYVDVCLQEARDNHVNAHFVKQKEHQLEGLLPNFGWISVDRLRHTLENTTQHYRAVDYNQRIKRHYKTRFPGARVERTNERVASDTFFSQVPASDDGISGHAGVTMAQIFTGCTSRHTAGFPMKSETNMPDTIEDYIRRHGAPTALITDNAKVAIGAKAQAILRSYVIGDYQSEPHYQNQNPAERRIQDIKVMLNAVMSRTGTPCGYWLLCLSYCIHLMNHLSLDSLGHQVPETVKTGQPADVSQFMQYRWWEPVYYLSGSDDGDDEKLGHWAGIAEHCGDILTYQIVSSETGLVLKRSDIRTATDPTKPNLRAEGKLAEAKLIRPAGEASTEIFSAHDLLHPGDDAPNLQLPKFSPEELIGVTFLRERDGTGQILRTKVIRQLINDDLETHQRIRFLIQSGSDDNLVDDVITYTELSDLVDQQNTAEDLNPDRPWIYKSVKAHQGPLHTKHPNYKGSKYNLLVLWEDGTETYEPLVTMIKDDPVTVADYAKKNGLLDTPGWKSLKRIARRSKLFKRMVNQAKLRSKRTAPIYKYGIQVPRNQKEAYDIDARNQDTRWHDAMDLELNQINDFDTFKDRGMGGEAQLLEQGYQKIRLHWVYDAKHDLRLKARLVANGAMTSSKIDGTYSSVVSLRSLRICLTLAELNGLRTMVGDISNAYLTAKTSELVYFIAGPEFGPLEGHTMVIYKALYGLRTSGARFHDKLSDTLRSMGFTPSYADPDVWMRDAGDCWEYLCTYVDDLAASLKDPEAFFNELQSPKHGYKLKGVGPPEVHLGGNFYRDEDGTLAWGAKKYIARILENYERLFNSKPKEYSSPIDHDAKPEIDTSKELEADDIIIYQSLVGCLQWLITLGRFDIMAAVMSLSRFRPAPRIGHMEHVQRVFGYLKKYPHGAIRFRTGIPDHESRHTPMEYDWSSTVYGNPVEEIPNYMPIPKGKPVRLTTFVDANLMHCQVTGRSATGVIHLLNQTPIAWHSKRQNTVETATYGSEFVAGRTASEQIIDIRFTLRMLGAPLDGPAWMFGDNESVVNSSSIPSHTLNKRHIALSFHRVRECVASKLLFFVHIPGKENISDCLTKFLTHSVAWPLIKPILFWTGDTADSNKAPGETNKVN